MPPRPANRRNRAVTKDPKSLTLAQLNALPKNSLILLASARNLVTTGTRMLRLAGYFFIQQIRLVLGVRTCWTHG